ncbi:MAG: HNH endonuclease signature motif containing protein [Acidobacteriota bacterium]
MITRKLRISREARERVAEAAFYRCGYCRTPESFAGYRLTIDHIIPESKGGTSVEENLWLACAACNQFKGVRTQARDPLTRRQVRLFNPRLQQWETHFAWHWDDAAKVLGLTACGRATVIALQLNRPEIVAARSLWVQVGWWPPKG